MKRELADADLFVNAGSAGMAPYEDRTPLEDLSLLPGKCAVADIVYNSGDRHGCCGRLRKPAAGPAEVSGCWSSREPKPSRSDRAEISDS